MLLRTCTRPARSTKYNMTVQCYRLLIWQYGLSASETPTRQSAVESYPHWEDRPAGEEKKVYLDAPNIVYWRNYRVGFWLRDTLTRPTPGLPLSQGLHTELPPSQEDARDPGLGVLTLVPLVIREEEEKVGARHSGHASTQLLQVLFNHRGG